MSMVRPATNQACAVVNRPPGCIRERRLEGTLFTRFRIENPVVADLPDRAVRVGAEHRPAWKGIPLDGATASDGWVLPPFNPVFPSPEFKGFWCSHLLAALRSVSFEQPWT